MRAFLVVIYFYMINTLFAVKQADSLTDLLGCTGKAWPCDEDNNTYPSTQMATVQESQRGVKGKKDTGDGTEKAKRIFEMRCFELIAGIPLVVGPGSSGGYSLLCPTCKVNLFNAVKIPPSKTEKNAETTTTFYDIYLTNLLEMGRAWNYQYSVFSSLV
jgi:hypothetical protein